MGHIVTARTLQGADLEVGKVRGSDRPHHPLPPLGGGVRKGTEGLTFQGAERLGYGIGGRGGLVIGVDIGQQGAAALLDRDGDLIEVVDLPLLPDGPASRPAINGPLFASILRDWPAMAAYVEFVGPRPSDGAKSAFAFGGAKATVETTLLLAGIRVSYITAPAWKRAIGIPPGKGMKDLARSAAVRRWPAKADLFARARDDGRAEAALIAFAGIMRDAAGK